MINISTRIPQPYIAVSLYRSTGPFQHLRANMDVQFMEPQSYNWLSLGMAEILFLERPFTDQDLELVKLAKSLNRKVWIDYDDNLFAVPPWNPAFRFYGEKVQKNIDEILKMADAVSVTTPALATVLNAKRSNMKPCTVIPNAFPNHLINFDMQQMSPRQKIVTWRGSNTHAKDLSLAIEGINAAMVKYPDWQFIFIGDVPYSVLEKLGPNYGTIPMLDPIPYLQTLFNMCPSIHIVPLEDNEFNRCKSNIAFLEATWAGAAVLAPDWEEWKDCYSYSKDHSFEESLLRMMGDNLDASKTRAKVASTLTLDDVNLLRAELIESLV